MADEILVKDTDGQWYILKEDKLFPYKSESTGKELPKGVSAETHEKMETKPVLPQPAPIISHQDHPLRQELEELIDEVIKQANNQSWDQVLQKRFRTIVSARLRDVRDSRETKDILSRDQKIGGMQMREPEIGQIIQSIEKAFSSFQNKWKEVEKKKEKEWLEKQKQAKQDEEKLKTNKEQEDLKNRYEEITGKTIEVKKQIPQPEPPKKQLPPKPRINVTPVKIQEKPKLEPRPIVPPPSGKVMDVRKAPRLMGPIEELSGLMLQDFRRIGKTPEESANKIIAKIGFLESESIKRKAEGIKAWRSSPLNQLYSFVMNASLSQKLPPEQIIKQKEQEGKMVLTLPEFYAIMELNQKLRF